MFKKKHLLNSAQDLKIEEGQSREMHRLQDSFLRFDSEIFWDMKRTPPENEQLFEAQSHAKWIYQNEFFFFFNGWFFKFQLLVFGDFVFWDIPAYLGHFFTRIRKQKHHQFSRSYRDTFEWCTLNSVSTIEPTRFAELFPEYTLNILNSEYQVPSIRFYIVPFEYPGITVICCLPFIGALADEWREHGYSIASHRPSLCHLSMSPIGFFLSVGFW